jgi:hypothetical protein
MIFIITLIMTLTPTFISTFIFIFSIIFITNLIIIIITPIFIFIVVVIITLTFNNVIDDVDIIVVVTITSIPSLRPQQQRAGICWGLNAGALDRFAPVEESWTILVPPPPNSTQKHVPGQMFCGSVRSFTTLS